MASYHLSVKVGKSGAGGRHAEYVGRSGAYVNYRSGEDLAFSEHGNMPAWAEHDPAEFFRQSDLHERKNGSVYREFEIAIPLELSPEQRVQFVRDFVVSELGTKHPYLWAIHNPKAAIGLSDQPHAHIMFSERTLDGIARDPEQFFKRFNAKAPEKGGCKKASAPATGQERKAALVDLRARFANLQNDHLAKHGHRSRVDHRSLADQGISRQPEKHLGPVRARNQKEVVPLLRHRGAQRTHAEAKAAAARVLTHHRKEQQHDRHRQYQARTAAPRRDSVPRMHERRHYRDADRAQHLLPGNAFDRLGEREAKQRADRVQLERERKREQWRDRLTDRRQAWQKKPAIEADKTYQAKPGQPVVYRWTAGNAAGLVAVKDYGDRIVPSGKPDGKVSNAKIVAMLTVAQEKGWKEVTFTGPQEFRERCAAAAVKRGLKLADEDLAKRFAPKIEKPVSTPERQRSPDKPIAASQSNTPAPVRAAPRSWYHPENIANREAQALQNAQQKAADAEQWQARIKKLSEQGKIMEYTRRIEVELQAKNAKAAAELRDKADLLAEQVASGEKSPAVLKTANEHVRNAELLERIAAEPLNRPAAPALDSIQGNDIQLADHFEKLIGWIRSTGGEHQKIPGDGAKSEWEGRFVKVDDQFAVQNVGKKHVIHILSDLDKKPLEGSKGNVLYGFDGKAKVTIQPDLTPVKGKGGIAD